MNILKNIFLIAGLTLLLPSGILNADRAANRAAKKELLTKISEVRSLLKSKLNQRRLPAAPASAAASVVTTPILLTPEINATLNIYKNMANDLDVKSSEFNAEPIYAEIKLCLMNILNLHDEPAGNTNQQKVNILIQTITTNFENAPSFLSKTLNKKAVKIALGALGVAGVGYAGYKSYNFAKSDSAKRMLTQIHNGFETTKSGAQTLCNGASIFVKGSWETISNIWQHVVVPTWHHRELFLGLSVGISGSLWLYKFLNTNRHDITTTSH